MSLNVVTLEMSLKPFRDPRNLKAVEAVCQTAFTQWNPLCQHADAVQVLLWPADGSEILAYKGDMDEAFEWAYWLGFANPHGNTTNDPNGVSLHSKPHHYMENPPTQTYRTLADIVDALKRIGQQITGKPIRVGATFDPGGEFARSTFKYTQHPEICIANTMGVNSFVGCYATLNADSTPYAGFPEGIPQGTTFGTYFGKQTQAFLSDLNFDYIWFSNGFGFGLETWSTVGPLFDGSRFNAQKAPEIREKIIHFWEDFRKACPLYPIETRGTNLGTGTDLASDAVPLREIYESKFNMYTPPNSPWAAIDGDFGLELMGYMSRIAELPTGKGFPFRFYVHDPWWLNSPWLDRYGRDAHDIVLPMAISRLDAQGQVQIHDAIQFLTIDDSYGQMPESCPNEIMPVVLRCMETKPDEAGLLTWVYPFDTFHDYVTQAPQRLDKAYFNDWFIRGAINNGLPLNTVVSDRALVTSMQQNPQAYAHTILMSLVPDAGTTWEAALFQHLDAGGKVLFYGPMDHASQKMSDRLNLTTASPLDGEVQVTVDTQLDRVLGDQLPTKMIHRSLYSAGPIANTLKNKADSATKILATAGELPIAIAVGDNIAWVRGSNCTDMSKKPKLPTMDDPTIYMHGDVLLRHALKSLGLHVGYVRHALEHRNPVLAISRHANAMWFAGYAKNSSAQWELALPDAGGCPVMVQCDAVIAGGKAVYQMPRAWRRECRVLVSQPKGVASCTESCEPHWKVHRVVSCTEQHSGHKPVKRRLLVTGLKDATVTFLPEPGFEDNTSFQINASWPFVNGPFAPMTHGKNSLGKIITSDHLTGDLLISW
jgi:hypothetical protein